MGIYPCAIFFPRNAFLILLPPFALVKSRFFLSNRAEEIFDFASPFVKVGFVTFTGAGGAGVSFFLEASFLLRPPSTSAGAAGIALEVERDFGGTDILSSFFGEASTAGEEDSVNKVVGTLALPFLAETESSDFVALDDFFRFWDLGCEMDSGKLCLPVGLSLVFPV
jgi:hypothetical protein